MVTEFDCFLTSADPPFVTFPPTRQEARRRILFRDPTRNARRFWRFSASICSAMSAVSSGVENGENTAILPLGEQRIRTTATPQIESWEVG